MFVDINDDPILMLFSWNYGGADPEETVSSGMRGDGRVVRIHGVGEGAVAGSKGQEMKLFAARSSGGMVGFRARGISSEDSDEFGVLKDLANKALLRLHLGSIAKNKSFLPAAPIVERFRRRLNLHAIRCQ
jgi:hypothetical protein